MFITHKDDPTMQYRIVAPESYEARMARGRQIVTDRAGIVWNAGANRIGQNGATEAIAWRYSYPREDI
jgi:hypothetical protein